MMIERALHLIFILQIYVSLESLEMENFMGVIWTIWWSPKYILVVPNIYNYVLVHCVKSIHIRSFSGPYFIAFGLNTEWYRSTYLSVFSQNVWKYGPEKLRIWTLFTQWLLARYLPIKRGNWYHFKVILGVFYCTSKDHQ